ncbi:M48 family metalloprotease [Nitrospirota bacterium]
MITYKTFIRTIFMAMCLVLLIASSAIAKEIRVETSRARIRSGPGNYYKVTHTAYRGAKLTVVSQENNWYKVKLKSGKTGFVSKRAFRTRATASRKTYRYKPRGRGVGTASSGQIMAATRGVSDMGMFARQYADDHDIDPELLGKLSVKPFTEREYRKFRSPLRSRSMGAMGFSGAELEDIDYEVGTAIAMRIVAAREVSRDQRLIKYVSLVGTALADKTPLYDEEFVFIVLEDRTPQSYSVPGGYVFITSGAITRMEDEAELAGVLAHEIVHVTERHGMAELEKQGTRIESEKALDELDAEVGKLGMDTGDREVAADLRGMADQLYEHIIGGRKREDEDKADRTGTNLLYTRGYRATGLADFLLKAGDSGSAKGERTSTYRDTADRSRMIKGHIKSKGISVKKGTDMKERFRRTAGQ